VIRRVARPLLIGIEAFIPPRASIAAGHTLVDVGYGRLEAGRWYLVRRVNGHYDLRNLPASPGSSLVSVRAIRGSPLPSRRTGSSSQAMTLTRCRPITPPGSSAGRRQPRSADRDEPRLPAPITSTHPAPRSHMLKAVRRRSGASMATIERQFYRSWRGPGVSDIDTWRLVFDRCTGNLAVRHQWETDRHSGVDDFGMAEFW